MGFRFRLASVLRLRQNLEERDLHLLEQTQHEIALVLQQMDDLIEQQGRAFATQQRDLEAGTPAVNLHLHDQARLSRKQQLRAMAAHLAQLRLRHKRQLEDYEDAKCKRQVLSDLWDRQLALHEARLAYRTQRAADDGFLARNRRG
jgi:hypothetical protein